MQRVKSSASTSIVILLLLSPPTTTLATMATTGSALPLPVANEHFSLPLAFPDPSITPATPRPALTPEQQSKLDELTSHFNAPAFALPTTHKALKHYWKAAKHGGGTGRGWGSYFKAAEVEEEAVFKELDGPEKCYWSTEGFQRVLRATKWDLHAAIRRAEETCVWRREFKVEDMRYGASQRWGSSEESSFTELGFETGAGIKGGGDGQGDCLWVRPQWTTCSLYGALWACCNRGKVEN